MTIAGVLLEREGKSGIKNKVMKAIAVIAWNTSAKLNTTTCFRTAPEIASMMASLHARAIARLRPNEAQREHVISIFREALITCQNDLDKTIQ